MDVPDSWRLAVFEGELHFVGEVGPAALDEGFLEVPLGALQRLLDLDSEVLFLPFALEVVLLDVRLAGVLGEALLRRVLDLLHEVGDILLVGDDRHHFLLHPLVDVVKSRADLYVFGVLLDQAEHPLQDEVEDRVVLDAFRVLAVTKVVDCFCFAAEVLLEALDLALVQVVPEDGQFFFDEYLIQVPDGAYVLRGGGAVDVPAFALLSRDDLAGEGLLLALRVEEVLLLADLFERALDLLLNTGEA